MPGQNGLMMNCKPDGNNNNKKILNNSVFFFFFFQTLFQAGGTAILEQNSNHNILNVKLLRNIKMEKKW